MYSVKIALENTDNGKDPSQGKRNIETVILGCVPWCIRLGLPCIGSRVGISGAGMNRRI